MPLRAMAYEYVCQVATGGTSTVHSIVYQGRHACLKYGLDVAFLEDYMKEARTIWHLDGAGGAPHLLAVASDFPAIITTYVQGTTFMDWVMEESGPVAESLLVQVLLQVARSLRSIHKLEIIHNDVKYDNIILNFSGGCVSARLVDFGLASESGSVCKMENPNPSDFELHPWLAPEVYYGLTTSSESDVYSLAFFIQHVVLKMLSDGRLPSSAEAPRPLLDLASRMYTTFSKRICITQVIEELECLLEDLSSGNVTFV